jgi:beta-aspartyl-peptidase (threonine type)
VERSINCLEGSGLFNAGIGSRRQLDGVMRMDASIMEGSTLRAGAVASIEQIIHPITAARLVMEESRHVLLVGAAATQFALYFNLERRSSTHAASKGLPFWRKRFRSLMKKIRKTPAHGTVGAVALDRSGMVAAGASTGGIDSMLPGRVGDTPLIGCGVYADQHSGAVSMTGIGEGIIRLVIAKTICDRLASGESPLTAGRRVLRSLVTTIKGTAGALVVSPDGRHAITHVTPYMAAGWWDGRAKPTVQGTWK